MAVKPRGIDRECPQAKPKSWSANNNALILRIAKFVCKVNFKTDFPVNTLGFTYSSLERCIFPQTFS